MLKFVVTVALGLMAVATVGSGSGLMWQERQNEEVAKVWDRTDQKGRKDRTQSG